LVFTKHFSYYAKERCDDELNFVVYFDLLYNIYHFIGH